MIWFENNLNWGQRNIFAVATLDAGSPVIIILLGDFHLWGRFYTVLQLTNFSGENSKSSHSSMFKEHVENSSALF